MFPSTSSRETLRFSENKIHCSSRDQSKCLLFDKGKTANRQKETPWWTIAKRARPKNRMQMMISPTKLIPVSYTHLTLPTKLEV